MAAPSGGTQYAKGTEIIVAAGASTSAITNGSVVECTQDDLQPADIDGAMLVLLEFDTVATSGFSAAPTAGATISVYEQKINSDGNDSPDLTTAYLYDYLTSWSVKAANEQQHFSALVPVNLNGAKYWVEWNDGGSGTASVAAGWELRATPIYAKTAA